MSSIYIPHRCIERGPQENEPRSLRRSRLSYTRLQNCPTAAALGWRPRMRSNTARPFWSVTIASPSIRHERADNAATAAAASGKRPAKSYPLRVRSRTPAASRRAMMRKPSCFISCSQSPPIGGRSTGRGRHGSMNPADGRENAAPRRRKAASGIAAACLACPPLAGRARPYVSAGGRYPTGPPLERASGLPGPDNAGSDHPVGSARFN
jgi:hypothetical protein